MKDFIDLRNTFDKNYNDFYDNSGPTFHLFAQNSLLSNGSQVLFKGGIDVFLLSAEGNSNELSVVAVYWR